MNNFKKYITILFAFVGAILIIGAWFFGSQSFPLVVVPDQYVGETFYIKRAVAFGPSVLAIYNLNNYPGTPVSTQTFSKMGIYGNFDMSVYDPDLKPGNYIGVLYSDPKNQGKLSPFISGIAKDIFGRQEESRFILK